jgi:hypothetical protein
MQFALNPVTFDRNHYNESTYWLQIDREAAIMPGVVDDGDGDIRPMHGDEDSAASRCSRRHGKAATLPRVVGMDTLRRSIIF